MPLWLQIAKGPVGRFTLAILALGLARIVILTLLDMQAALRRSSGQPLPYRQILGDTLSWLFPFARLHRVRPAYSFASYGLHLGLLGAALFLGNHLEILKFNLGFAWIALPKPLLDLLTLLALASGLALLLFRVYNRHSRQLSQAADYLLLALILNLCASGYLAGRAWNPAPYEALMLFHTLNGIAILLLTPFSKIAHCVLYPFIRLSSEISWRLVPHAGEQVVGALYGSEGRKI